VEQFFVDMRSAGVVQPIGIYTGRWYWGGPGSPGHMGNPDGRHLGRLWDSNYVNGAGDPWALLGDLQPGDMAGRGVTPDYFPAYGGWDLESRLMRQFSSSALIQDMSIDVSVFYGTRNDLATAWWAGSIEPGPAAPAPAGPAQLAADGAFGVLTIRRLQEITGATVDGRYGPETRKKQQTA
jgi:hypothetical protein